MEMHCEENKGKLKIYEDMRIFFGTKKNIFRLRLGEERCTMMLCYHVCEGSVGFTKEPTG